jgi:5-methylcytosine-specific restriction endonuclease McrA
MDGVVLVLNQNYEPLNVCNLPRAFRLVFGEKAEVIEYDHQVIRTPRTEYRAPSVIRLQYQIRRPRPRVKLSRREVFARDRHTCQYCGRQSHDLTLDHVMPRHLPAEHPPHGGQDARGGPPPPASPGVRAAQRHLLAVHALSR